MTSVLLLADVHLAEWTPALTRCVQPQMRRGQAGSRIAIKAREAEYRYLRMSDERKYTSWHSQSP